MTQFFSKPFLTRNGLEERYISHIFAVTNNFVLVVKTYYNTETEGHIQTEKNICQCIFFPLVPSVNEVEVGNESSEQMGVHYFLELQNPYSVFAMHYLSYVANDNSHCHLCMLTHRNSSTWKYGSFFWSNTTQYQIYLKVLCKYQQRTDSQFPHILIIP